MRPLGGVFLWGIVLAAGTTNFVVKHTVQRLDDELNNTRRKAVAEQKQIHDLTAEWTYLNQPELLSDLNRRFVGLVPVGSKQIQRNLDDIPLRPVAAPAPEPTPVEPQTAAAMAPAPAVAQMPTFTPIAIPIPTTGASQILPVAATSVTRVSPPPAPAAAAPAGAPSLDALFAQVAGGR